MGQQVGSLEAELLLEIAEFVRSAKKAEKVSSGFARRAGQTFKTFGKIAGAGLVAAGAGLALFAAKSVQLGADATETLNLLGETFGRASQDVIGFTDDLAKRTKRSRFELRAFAADLGALTVSLTGSRTQGAELAKQFTSLAVDVASFRNLQTAEVVAKFKSAIVGEVEAVKSLGVAMTATALQNEALRLGFKKQFKDLDTGTKVSIRAAFVQRALADAVGDAERTAGSFANQQKALIDQVKQSSVVIGQELTPAASLAAGEMLRLLGIVSDNEDSLRDLVQGGVSFAVDALGFMASVSFSAQIALLKLGKIPNVIGKTFVEAFIGMIDSMADFGQGAADLARGIPGVGEKIAEAFEKGAKGNRELAASGRKNFAIFGAGVAFADKKIAELEKDQENLLISVQGVNARLRKEAIEARSAADSIGGHKAALEEAAEAAKTLAELKAFSALSKDARAAAAAVQEFLTPTKLGVATLEDAEIALMGVRDEMLKIAVAAAAGTGDIEALKVKLEQLGVAESRLTGFINEQRDAQKARAEEAIELGKAIGDAFGSAFGAMLAGAQDAGQAFKEFAKSASVAALDAAEKIALAHAVEWATGAGASQAGIPIIGPALAAAAATAAFALARGFIQNLNQGGFVGGTGSRDTVPAMLTPGEFVVSKPAVRSAEQFASSANVQAQGGGTGSRSGGDINLNVTVKTDRPFTNTEVDRFVNRQIVPSLQRAKARGKKF